MPDLQTELAPGSSAMPRGFTLAKGDEGLIREILATTVAVAISRGRIEASPRPWNVEVWSGTPDCNAKIAGALADGEGPPEVLRRMLKETRPYRSERMALKDKTGKVLAVIWHDHPISVEVAPIWNESAHFFLEAEARLQAALETLDIPKEEATDLIAKI
jgi:hypothetical protein